eukprot:maker-scaffold_1-snap-gene-29.47-mRNA-1 protein AED:0.00 eAED:0.00 QI:201/1/1/1/1/1/2/362/377
MEFKTYGNQVAGSFPLIQRNPKEVCKPATSHELKVYQVMKKSKCSYIQSLRKFTPKFLGEVVVNPRKDVDLSLITTPQSAETEICNSSTFPQTLPRKTSSSQMSLSQNLSPCHRRKRSYTEDFAKTFQLSGESSTEAEISPYKRKKSNSFRNENRWSYLKLWESFQTERKEKVLQTDKRKKPENLVYLVLENVTYNLKRPHVMDLKMGTQQYGSFESAKKKKSKELRCKNTTSSSLGLRIAGVQMYCDTKYLDEGIESGSTSLVFKDKYWGRGLDVSGVKRAFSCFFGEGKYRNELKRLIEDLGELITAIKNICWRFYGCSALLSFDTVENNEKEVSLKIIDFAKTEMSGNDGYDRGLVFGLETMKKIFVDLLKEAK